MEQKKQPIPDFMKKFYEGSDEEGQVILENVAKQYEQARQDFMRNEFVQKSAFQRDWENQGGQRRQLDPDEMITPLKEKYAEAANNVATQHGYKETEEGETEQQSTGQSQRHQQKNPAQENQQQKSGQSEKEEQQPRTKRELFLQNLKDMRGQQGQTQKQERAESQQQSSETQTPQTTREKFLANVQSMKASQGVANPGMK